MKVVRMESEKFCRFGNAPFGVGHRFYYQLTFSLGDRLVVAGGGSLSAASALKKGLRQVFGKDLLTGTQDHRALDGVGQFTDVPGPVIGFELVESLSRKAYHRTFHFLAKD